MDGEEDDSQQQQLLQQQRKKRRGFSTPTPTNIVTRQPQHMPLITNWLKTLKGASGLQATQAWQNHRDGMLFIARDMGARGAVRKEYSYVDSWEILHREILGFPAEWTGPGSSRNFYELWKEHQRVKLFFDFEIKGPFDAEVDESSSATGALEPVAEFTMAEPVAKSVRNVRPSDEEINARLESICRRAISKIREHFGVEIEYDWFARQNSNSLDKISYHLILTKGLYFADCSHLKTFFNVMFPKEHLNNPVDYPEFVGLDPGVYGNGRMLRLALCSKLYEVRPLEPDARFTFPDQIVTYCPMEPFEVVHEDGTSEMLPHKVVEFCGKRTKAQSARKSMDIDDSPKLADTHQDKLEELLMTIDCTLAQDYDFWIQTGIKLKRAGGTLAMWAKWTEDYFKWVSATEQRTSARVNRLSDRWEGFDTTSDLHMFLSHVEKYGDTAKVHEYRNSSLEFVGLLHNEIGMAFHLRHPQHVYSNGTWWYFNGVRWRKDVDSMWISRSVLAWQIEINRKISQNKTKLVDLGSPEEEEEEETYEPGKRGRAPEDTESTATRPMTAAEKGEAEQLKKLNKKLRQIKKITQDGTIGNNNALKTIYFNDMFYEELDSYHDLLGFKNGVLDLTTGEFRKALPEDKITLSTGYDFAYEPNAAATALVRDLIAKVYPDPEVRKYVVRFHASCLTGRCPDDSIHFYTGMNSQQTGANAKSTVDLLMLKLLGEYAVVGHPSLLTGSRESASQANSALMALKMKRYVSFQEINDPGTGKVTLNMQIIKGLTGGDPQSGRELFERQSRPFDPTWKIVISANKLPPMSNDDGGSRRRLRDIPHEAKFVTNPDDPKYTGMPYVYQAEPKLKERVKTDKDLWLAYLHILIQEHLTWREEGLQPCERIERHTLEYLNDQDVYRSWIEETFKYTGNAEDTVTRTQIEELFRTQRKTLMQQFGTIKKDAFILELRQPTRLGIPELVATAAGNKEEFVWSGWKMDESLAAIVRASLERSKGDK